jgi:hypothetical protein
MANNNEIVLLSDLYAFTSHLRSSPHAMQASLTPASLNDDLHALYMQVRAAHARVRLGSDQLGGVPPHVKLKEVWLKIGRSHTSRLRCLPSTGVWCRCLLLLGTDWPYLHGNC